MLGLHYDLSETINQLIPIFSVLILLVWVLIRVFKKTFHKLHNYQIFKEMLLSKINSCTQGYNLISGTTHPISHPLKSPITRRSCCWYQYKIEKLITGRYSFHWEVIESGTSSESFMISDDTGTCIVLPENAEFIGLKRGSWRSSEPDENPLKPIKKRPNILMLIKIILSLILISCLFEYIGLGKINPMICTLTLIGMGSYLSSFSKIYRLTEYIIAEGENIHAIGSFRTTTKSSILSKKTLNLTQSSIDDLRSKINKIKNNGQNNNIYIIYNDKIDEDRSMYISCYSIDQSIRKERFEFWLSSFKFTIFFAILAPAMYGLIVMGIHVIFKF